jgi:hypothetical protein
MASSRRTPVTEQTKQRQDDKNRRAQTKKVDEEIEESFPASDPPAFAGGKSFVGAPKDRETPQDDTAAKATEVQEREIQKKK